MGRRGRVGWNRTSDYSTVTKCAGTWTRGDSSSLMPVNNQYQWWRDLWDYLLCINRNGGGNIRETAGRSSTILGFTGVCNQLKIHHWTGAINLPVVVNNERGGGGGEGSVFNGKRESNCFGCWMNKTVCDVIDLPWPNSVLCFPPSLPSRPDG